MINKIKEYIKLNKLLNKFIVVDIADIKLYEIYNEFNKIENISKNTNFAIPPLFDSKDYVWETIADEVSKIPKYRIYSKKSKQLYLVEYYKRKDVVLVINLPKKPLKTTEYTVLEFSKRIKEIIL